MAINDTFLEASITATENAIRAYEAAELAFASDGLLQSYKIDTGQTSQSVTRADLGMIRTTIASLYNRLSTLCARKSGAASIGRPGW